MVALYLMEDEGKRFGKIFCSQCGEQMGRENWVAKKDTRVDDWICLTCLTNTYADGRKCFWCKKKSKEGHWLSTYTKQDRSETGTEWFCISCAAKNKGVGRAKP